ncbi:MAG: L-glutamate gamma-semialdehyde dehydrogenase, partial [Planctomycetes bacterium]|nr:L-glutamate gamma-semialdehyde dehydrogenase [Planctomycetota bacterium]
MADAVFRLDLPRNEPVRAYAPGAAETSSLAKRLAEMARECVEIPCIAGGREYFTGKVTEWRAPHDHSKVLCRWHAATPEVLAQAIEAAERARREWQAAPYQLRLAIFLKAAQLLAGPWRDTVNAATMLGQSKTCFQAEIDAACELIDFWRFNAYFALHQIYPDQPQSADGTWNYIDHRPLEGFVYAITPFNFTSIAGNLPTAPALMGNVALWKPSHSAMLSNYYVMKLLEAAGLPPGVVNFVPGSGRETTAALLGSEHFAGVHFTGSTEVFRGVWKKIAENLERYRGYPRIVGETGGKDFIFAHESAEVEALVTACVRGAFEYQGQKCSAASRAYLPRKLWARIKDRLVAEVKGIAMGDVQDFKNFMGAVIDERAYEKIAGTIDSARNDGGARIVAGGGASRKNGWFIQPTIIECSDPRFRTMQEEIFGPVLSVYAYDEDDLAGALELCDRTSPYALTGAVFAAD